MNNSVKIILILILSINQINAQKDLEWLKLNVDNSDIPSNLIYSVAVDSNNNKWIGTDKGLAKFDGTDWLIFNKQNDLISNFVTSVVVDNENKIWICDSLLSCYDGNKWIHRKIPNHYGTPVFSRKMIFDNSNRLWMLRTLDVPNGESTDGVICFYESEFTVYDQETTGLNLRDLSCITANGDEIWVGGDKKLFSFTDNIWYDRTWDSLTQANISANITNIHSDNNGDIWILGHYPMGSVEGFWIELNIYRLENYNKYYHISIPSELTKWFANAITIDHLDNKWIGTDIHGLLKIQADSVYVFSSNTDGIYSNKIDEITIDKNNNKWLRQDNSHYGSGILVHNEDGVILTSIKSGNNTSPSFLELKQNYPNPFNSSSTINYSISKSSNIFLELYDILGNKVKTLESGYRKSGEYSYILDMSKFSSGIYFYCLKNNTQFITKKIIYLK